MGTIKRDQQFNGFRQVWFEHANGTFDGPYSVYWGEGEMRCMHGHYTDGAQHGLWTHWGRDGSVTRQVTFDHDSVVEDCTCGPWAADDTAPPTSIT